MSSKADFENIEQKVSQCINSDQYRNLLRLISRHDNIYVLGNGGLHYVASHMATDMSRLLDNKFVHSFDSFGFITSSANDFGFESIFERWLECCICLPQNNKGLIIGIRDNTLGKPFSYFFAQDRNV